MPTRLSLALLLIAVSACTCTEYPPVNPGNPFADAARSTVVVAPPQVVADGQQVARITVTALDKDGLPVEGVTVELVASGSDNVVGAPAAATDMEGAAEGTLASTRAETKRLTVRLRAGDKSVELSAHPEVNFIPGAATQLAFLSQPASTTAGTPLATPQVVATDAHGNRVTAPVTVALALEGGTAGAVLDGTASRVTAAGVVDFDGLRIERAGTGYTLRATAPGLQDAVSSAFDITAAAFSQTNTTFEVGPDNVVANGTDTTTVTLTVRDAYNNPVVGQAVSLAASGSANTLSAASGTTDADGRFVATLQSTKAELKTVDVSLGGAALAQQSVSFIPGAPARLAFVTQPAASTTAGATLSPLQVVAMDAHGNLAASPVQVALALEGGTAGAVLDGTTSRTTVAGATAFEGLRIERAGTGYALRATALNLQAAVSSPFDITAGAVSLATTTVEVDRSADVVANGTDEARVTVTVRDAFSNPVAGRSVSLAASGTGNTLSAPSGTTGADGRFVATLRSTRAETKTVVATLDGAELATHPQVGFVPGPPARLAYVTQPASTTAGLTLASVQVEVLDAHGNRVLAVAKDVTVALVVGGVTLEGTTLRTSVAGVSAFTDLVIKRAGTGYELRATAQDVQEAVSSTFDISAAAPSAAESTFAASPTSLEASTTTTADLTVTVLDAFRNPVGGKGVTLEVTSGSFNVLSVTSGTTGADGTLSATFRSTKAEPKSLRATVADLATPLDAALTVVPGPLESLVLSVNPDTVEADGVTPIALTTTAEDSFGNRISGLAVALSATGTDNVFAPASGDTDASGVFTSALRSTGYGQKTVRAAAGDKVSLRNVTFLRPSAAVSGVQWLGLSDVTKGCVTLQYTVAQSESARPDVTVEYEAAGVFKRATQAGSLTGSGVTGVATTPTGITHRFLWNSTADLPALEATTRVRITTTLPGALPRSETLDNVLVSNGPRYGAAQASAAGTGPQALALADMDRDGKQDAVVLNPSVPAFTVLRGDGAGAFTAAAPQAAGAGSSLMRVVDVTRDGRSDVVLAGGSQLHTAVNGALGYTLVSSANLTPAPVGLETGDFNRDGMVDAVVALADGTVSVLAGNGAGGFTALASSSSGASQPRQLAVGDFNRDGKLDVALADADGSSGGVRVLLGTGSGSFGVPTRLATGAGADAVRTADLNQDGRLDLLVAHRTDGTLVVARGGGDGTFTLNPAVAVGAQPVALALRDLDGDSRLDVLVAGVGQSVYALKGLGGGLLGTPMAVDAGGATAAVAAADLNQDGKADLVATRPADGNLVRMLSAQVSRCDASLLATQLLATETNPFGVALTDFDGDARMDMAVASANNHNLSVARGLGNGRFAAMVTYTLGAALKPQAVVAGDFNGDTRPDLVTANNGSSNVSLLLNDGTGGFGPASTWPLGVGVSPRGLAVGDFDGDKRLDLVVANGTGSNVTVLFGNGDGTLPRSRTFTTGTNPYAVLATDLDGDGDLDLATANNGSGNVSVLLGDGAGAFTAAPLAGTNPAPTALGLGDFDGDQRPDLAVTGGSPGGKVTLLLGQGNGTFLQRPAVDVGSQPLGLVVADFDLDGDLDVTTANNGSEGVTLLLGDGKGALAAAAAPLTVGSGLTALAGADLDGDGRTDLVASVGGVTQQTSLVDNRVAILRSAGSGLATAPLLTTPPQTPTSTFMSGLSADLDRDGVPDILMPARSSRAVVIWRGTGSGGFGTGTTATVGNSPEVVTVGDVDGNGTPDVLAANSVDGTVHVLSGDGSGGLAPGVSAGANITSAAAMMLEHLDSDGAPDLMVVSASSTNSSVLRNNGSGGYTLYKLFANDFSAPKGVTFADFNGDGRRDVALCGSFTSTPDRVNVMLALGGPGDFSTPRSSQLLNMDLSAIAAADVNRDGKMDVVVSQRQTSTSPPLAITLLGNGDGTFVTGGSPLRVALPVQPKHLALADVDADGAVDLLVLAQAGLSGAPAADSLTLLRGDGTGLFGGATASYERWALRAGVSSDSVSSTIGTADLNRDGVMDFFTGAGMGTNLLLAR